MTSTAPETFVTTTKVAADPNAVAAPLPMATAKYRLPPLHPEGRKFVAIAVAITLFFGFVLDYAVAGWLMAGVTGWVAAFFRDPERTTPQGEGLIVSPADGMVCMVGDVEVPRQLAGEGGLTAERVRRVSIFMNVFDVHINRTPITGTVSRVVYVPGKFLNADLDKASEDNERQYFIVDSADGVRVGFTQIAGLVARRIMRFVQTGDTVVAGQRIGLIRFGSRLDVYLPDGYGCQVLAGQRCVAGETVLARLGHSDVAAGVTQ